MVPSALFSWDSRHRLPSAERNALERGPRVLLFPAVFLRVLQGAPFTDVQLAELLPWEAPAPALEGALLIHTLLSTGQEWKSEAGVEDKAKCRQHFWGNTDLWSQGSPQRSGGRQTKGRDLVAQDGGKKGPGPPRAVLALSEPT